jgi:eukaryotic-like serine/threonine-protein kinase
MDLMADPPYYIMPLYETSLEKRFSDVCGNEERISPLFRTILLAMEFAHEQGILHRDLKPENILINADLTEIAIGDFGVGRNLNSESSRITAPGSQLGSVHYMPIECSEIAGKESFRSARISSISS